MGQQNSQLIDPDTPPQTLSERSLEAVAKLIKDGQVNRIVVLTGAGISTAAGIPDFRSPGTGLYNNLARLNLPHPEAVFELDFFEENPYPFYALAKELYPGNFHPTVSHAFVALLARKRLLRKLFTQNIDCLERVAGVPGDLIIEAHGSFASQRCVDCKVPFTDDEAMREHVARGEPPLCPREGCNTGIIKPDIVFFGEQLPAAFFAEREVPSEADLLLVLGTSLSVQPFASLPMFAGDSVPRVLFNLQRVGDLGTRPDDVLCLGDCDAGVRRLADALGWRDELERLWEDTVGVEEANRQRNRKAGVNAAIEDEVDEISEAVEHRLKLDPTSPPFAPASSASVSVPGKDRVAQEATAFTNDARGQGQDAEEAKEEVVGGKNHGEDGRQAHAPDAPALFANGAAPGFAEAGTAEGGGGGAAGGVEAEDQRAQEDAPETSTATATGASETGQRWREEETEKSQAMPSEALGATSPSPPTSTPSPPAAEQQQNPSPKPKKKKKTVMITTDSPEVIEPPPLPPAAEEEEAEVSLPPPPSPPLLPHVIPGDATTPSADATAAAKAKAAEDGAAQPLSTLPALKDPPREKVYGEIVGGHGE